VLALGVSDHVISKNNVEDNNYVGIGVLGWCTALAGGPRDCGDGSGLRWPPQAENNLVSQNYLSGNGGNPPPLPPQFLLPDVDLLYAQFEIPEEGSGNCFKKNKPKNGVTSFAAYPETGLPPPLPLGVGGPLPTDGC
jgi:hypothetical protein